MSTVEAKYEYTTIEQSIISKDWAAGTAKQVESNEYIINPEMKGVYKKVIYPPAWLKIIDEPIVNALDHLVSCRKVTLIRINYDTSGRVIIYNNGPGIEVEIHKVASNKCKTTVYVPTFVFGHVFQGSNQRNRDSIIGGTNGLGAKLANCFSTDFAVETADEKNKLLFQQQWKDHMKIVGEPLVKNLENVSVSRREPHTKLNYMPDYTGIFGYSAFTPEVYNTLVDIIHTRAIMASLYANKVVEGGNFQLLFNDKPINVPDTNRLCKILYPDAQVVSTTLYDGKSPYSWDVSIAITDTTACEYPYLSIVNGIVVRDGKHLKHLLSQIIAAVKADLVKLFSDKDLKFSNSYVTNNIFLFANTQIPGPSWTGQRKDILEIDPRKINGYKFTRAMLTSVSIALKDTILESIFARVTKLTPRKTPEVDYSKYVPAEFSGTKQSQKCYLLLVEGLSAMSQVVTGVANKLKFQYYGVFSLTGVIVNARKECVLVDTQRGRHIKPKPKLANNSVFNTLLGITGLNIYNKYDPSSSTYSQELSKLKYGSIICCVDQDLDGKGNILGLIINMFQLFWPKLVEKGFIKWFCTPIIRAFPRRGGKVLEFYGVAEHKKWEETANISTYTIQYYKGLGNHKRDETINMFGHLHQHLYTYYLDRESDQLFEIYFGKIPDLRKKELAQPSVEPTMDELKEQEHSMRMSCSAHLRYETNAYQKDNLDRKLDSVIDGQNQAGRKILDGLLKAFAGSQSQQLITELAGYISKEQNYHHGISSLCDSITSRGLITPGGKQLPIIVPLSNFGSRNGGGKDAAQPRYLNCKLNKKLTDLLFSRLDYPNLEFNFENDKRLEPRYFVPILPLVILESSKLPSHGWRLKTWARDVFTTIRYVKYLIMMNGIRPPSSLSLCTYKGSTYEWRGVVRPIRGDPYTFGLYSYNSTTNIVVITELPLGVWTTKYLTYLQSLAVKYPTVIIKVVNNSDDTNINIRIQLRQGAVETIEQYDDSPYADGFEEFFKLRANLKSYMNLMYLDKTVKSYNTYEDVVEDWFPVRKRYYALRIERQEVLLQIDITYYKNIIRYVEEKIQLGGKKYSEMNSILTNCNYCKIAYSRLSANEFTHTGELHDALFNSPEANYDYLLNLSDRLKSEEKLTEYQAALARLEAELDNLQCIASKGEFKGAAIWAAELDKLQDVIQQGQQTRWLYNDATKYTYD
jgi:DNA topoisomerase II